MQVQDKTPPVKDEAFAIGAKNDNVSQKLEKIKEHVTCFV